LHVEEKPFAAEAFDGIDPARAALYRLCAAKNIPITVMKPFGSGKLLSAAHTPFARPLTPVQCIHYALTRPGVASVLAGCQSRAEVLEAARYLDATEEERDYSAVIRTFEQDFHGVCMYCNHCLPCPVGIDVAAVTRCLDVALLAETEIPPRVTEQYVALSARGSDCVACGNCEARCPFSVKITGNMRRAAEVFEA
jgi:predicted aldo/keto reductase-like oxidoreductase